MADFNPGESELRLLDDLDFDLPTRAAAALDEDVFLRGRVDACGGGCLFRREHPQDPVDRSREE